MTNRENLYKMIKKQNLLWDLVDSNKIIEEENIKSYNPRKKVEPFLSKELEEKINYFQLEKNLYI